jgi:hypothetical protein
VFSFISPFFLCFPCFLFFNFYFTPQYYKFPPSSSPPLLLSALLLLLLLPLLHHYYHDSIESPPKTRKNVNKNLNKTTK